MSHIRDEVNKIVKLGGWEKLFAGLKARTNPYLDKYPATFASKDSNFSKNRYRDVLPFDATRVKLETNDGGDGYINASFVHIERARRKYILTQGPLQSTLADFWHMIWEQKCPAIIMLNKYNENNFPKCHAYVPDDEDDIMIVDSDGTRVKLVSQTYMPSYTCSKIEIDRQSTVDGKPKTLGKRTVTHYQYTEWPDFGVPSDPDKFLDFLGAIRSSGVLDNTESEPVAVHCSAGIGRSGTFVMVDTSLVLISENVRVDVISLLEDLRQYRYGLVQTAEQLRFTYEAIIKGVEKFIGPLDEVGKRLVEAHPRLSVAARTPVASPSPSTSSSSSAAGQSSASKSPASRQHQQDRPMFRRQAGRSDSLAELILLEDLPSGTRLETTDEEIEPVSPLPASPADVNRPLSSNSTCNGASEKGGEDENGVIGEHDNDTGRLSVAAMDISDRGQSDENQPRNSNKSPAPTSKVSSRPPSSTKGDVERVNPVDAITATPNMEAVENADAVRKDHDAEQKGKADDAEVCDKKDAAQQLGVGVGSEDR